ncbi:MAG: hypothetical protein ACYDH4_09560 [Candidatus Cryosericum sp.]
MNLLSIAGLLAVGAYHWMKLKEKDFMLTDKDHEKLVWTNAYSQGLVAYDAVVASTKPKARPALPSRAHWARVAANDAVWQFRAVWGETQENKEAKAATRKLDAVRKALFSDDVPPTEVGDARPKEGQVLMAEGNKLVPTTPPGGR